MDERNFTAAPAFADKLRALDWKKVAIVVVALALVVVLLAVLIPALFGSSKNDPIKYMEKYDNAKEADLIRFVSEAFNGVDKGNAAKILKLLAKTDGFKEDAEEFEDSRKDAYEDKVDEYGKNFRISYKNDRDVEEKLDRDDLKSCREKIRSAGESLVAAAKDFKSMEKTDQKDLAEDMDIGYSELKELYKYLEALGRELKGASVDDGYQLEVIRTVTGKELDEPEEDEVDMVVLKVNGKWVNYEVLLSCSYGLLDLLR